MTRCFLAIVAFGVSACASAPSSRAVDRLSGAEMYARLCASCHGVDGSGDGPTAPAMKMHTPDLTRIAYRDGGEFPTEDVRRAIDGRWDRPAHGSRDMPVWGRRFYDRTQENDAAERARVDSMIERLVDHLRSIQVE